MKTHKPKKVAIVLPKPKPVSFQSTQQVLENARTYPIVECSVIDNWEQGGMTTATIARELAPGRILYASFVIDAYCLGVKDAMVKVDISRAAYTAALPILTKHQPKLCDSAYLHELVYGAVEYAARFGFEPHPDYKKACLVLDPPEMHPRTHQIEFGKDGQPFYANGPYETPARQRQILNTLRRTAGEGNFKYIVLSDQLENPFGAFLELDDKD